jgi:hypothetical protein
MASGSSRGCRLRSPTPVAELPNDPCRDRGVCQRIESGVCRDAVQRTLWCSATRRSSYRGGLHVNTAGRDTWRAILTVAGALGGHIVVTKPAKPKLKLPSDVEESVDDYFNQEP